MIVGVGANTRHFYITLPPSPHPLSPLATSFIPSPHISYPLFPHSHNTPLTISPHPLSPHPLSPPLPPQVLRERIEVVSQSEEHYRELIITDLDDLRLKLSQANFDDEPGDARDVTRVYRQVMGEGMEHEDLQKVNNPPLPFPFLPSSLPLSLLDRFSTHHLTTPSFNTPPLYTPHLNTLISQHISLNTLTLTNLNPLSTFQHPP